MKTKVFIGKKHLAYVNTELMYAFRRECGVVNYISWVRELSFNFCGASITTDEGIQALKQAVEAEFFEGIGDWLNYEMRRRMAEKKGERTL